MRCHLIQLDHGYPHPSSARPCIFHPLGMIHCQHCCASEHYHDDFSSTLPLSLCFFIIRTRLCDKPQNHASYSDEHVPYIPYFVFDSMRLHAHFLVYSFPESSPYSAPIHALGKKANIVPTSAMMEQTTIKNQHQILSFISISFPKIFM